MNQFNIKTIANMIDEMLKLKESYVKLGSPKWEDAALDPLYKEGDDLFKYMIDQKIPVEVAITVAYLGVKLKLPFMNVKMPHHKQFYIINSKFFSDEYVSK